MPSIIHSGGVVSLLCLYLLAVLLALLPAPANAALVNVTVDDNSLSPTAITYLPPDTWSFGPTCPTCDAHPDANRAFKGTWHDTSFFPATESGAGQAQTASLVFDGSAIYAYCIIAPSTDKLDGFTDLRFFIDNEAVGSFTLDPSATGQNDYLYNVLVYGNSSIAPGSGPQHTFTLQNGHPGGNTSLAILDYIVYSVDNSDASSSETGSFSITDASSSISSTLSASSSHSSSSTASLSVPPSSQVSGSSSLPPSSPSSLEVVASGSASPSASSAASNAASTSVLTLTTPDPLRPLASPSSNSSSTTPSTPNDGTIIVAHSCALVIGISSLLGSLLALLVL